MKCFDNVQHVLLCKIPSRFDSHNINSKVSRFNELLVERYLDTEEWITVIDTIPPEIRYYYHDGLHMSHFGVTKLCSIVMSNLYKIIAPMSYRKRSHFKSNRRASRRQCHAISSSVLNFGYWNLEYFRTAQIYFNNLLVCLDFFAISEHCLFKEQLGLLEASTDHIYKCIAVSASDNPPILSGKQAHGGVALFWKQTLDDLVTP